MKKCQIESKDAIIQRTYSKEMTSKARWTFFDQASSSSSSLSTPPPLPNEAVEGFNSEGYWDLIQSLPEKDRSIVLKEIESPSIRAKANTLKQQLANNEFVGTNLLDSRNIFLAALLCLQKNDITKNQLATLHILDSAIRTLYASPCMYLIRRQVKNDKLSSETYTQFLSPFFPEKIQRYHYSFIADEEISPDSQSGERCTPIIHRFFNFTESEKQYFNQQIALAPASEKFFVALIAPEIGCWSSLIFSIQNILKCMQVLKWLTPIGDNDTYLQNMMVVPSFTMFQIAVDAKANTLGRRPVELVPTYYYLEENHYSRYKSVGRIPLTLYLPEVNPELRYDNYNGQFRTKIDNYFAETAFAGALHDVYHAFREMMMSENVAAARIRLALIAKYHFYNQKDHKLPPMDNILIDGELIYSYLATEESMFAREANGSKHIFGDLFHISSTVNHLHPDLKKAFIADMVIHKDEWLECFSLGKDDLRPPEQMIYDEIEAELELERMASLSQLSLSI